MPFERLILKIKRADTPFTKWLKSFAWKVLKAGLPTPSFAKPLFRALYHLHFVIWYAGRWVLNFFYRYPLVRSRCTQVGENLLLTLLPDISGHADIIIGDNVSFFGKWGVSSARVFDKPRLVLGNNVNIGHDVAFSVNKEILIEDGVNIASGTRVRDNDGHPRNTEMRAADAPTPQDEVKAVRICRNAWLGGGCYVMKGVTIGEGAIIGAGSVVVTDIPPWSIAMGNPARVVVKDTRKAPPTAAAPASTEQS